MAPPSASCSAAQLTSCFLQLSPWYKDSYECRSNRIHFGLHISCKYGITSIAEQSMRYITATLAQTFESHAVVRAAAFHRVCIHMNAEHEVEINDKKMMRLTETSNRPGLRLFLFGFYSAQTCSQKVVAPSLSVCSCRQVGGTSSFQPLLHYARDSAPVRSIGLIASAALPAR
jgi:hypothetical protein